MFFRIRRTSFFAIAAGQVHLQQHTRGDAPPGGPQKLSQPAASPQACFCLSKSSFRLKPQRLCFLVTAMAQVRVAVLARHLVSAQPAELPEFDPREVYLFLTRDNVELRERMLEHLKVCCLCWRALAAGRIAASWSH